MNVLEYRAAFATVERRYPADVRQGDWEIRHYAVSDDEERLQRLRAAINPWHAARVVPAGTYVGLWHDRRGVVMSATPDEMDDHRAPYQRAMRLQTDVRVLVNGLGLGMVLSGLLTLPNVAHVDVVEIDADVVRLGKAAFADELSQGRVWIYQADALEFRPERGVRYDVVWHDIWDAICGDNLVSMRTLKRRYARRAGWQGCWAEYLVAA